jgi:hypothetical protein
MGMSRRFQFSLILLAAALLAVGQVVIWFDRAADRHRLAEQSQQIYGLGKRLDTLAGELKQSEAELGDQIRRMGQRPPRGKIEETYDKFDVPQDIIER